MKHHSFCSYCALQVLKQDGGFITCNVCEAKTKSHGKPGDRDGIHGKKLEHLSNQALSNTVEFLLSRTHEARGEKQEEKEEQTEEENEENRQRRHSKAAANVLNFLSQAAAAGEDSAEKNVQASEEAQVLIDTLRGRIIQACDLEARLRQQRCEALAEMASVYHLIQQACRLMRIEIDRAEKTMLAEVKAAETIVLSNNANAMNKVKRWKSTLAAQVEFYEAGAEARAGTPGEYQAGSPVSRQSSLSRSPTHGKAATVATAAELGRKYAESAQHPQSKQSIADTAAAPEDDLATWSAYTSDFDAFKKAEKSEIKRAK